MSTTFSGQTARYNRQTVASMIDHTKLTFNKGEDPEFTIIQLCYQATENRFAAVCVRPEFVTLAKRTLGNSSVKVATVIGFPKEKLELADEKANPTVGSFSTESKVKETAEAVANGADELDLVLNVAVFKAEASDGAPETRKELLAVKAAAQGKPIKVILETDLLTGEEMIAATEACIATGMATVKTSTGMLNGGRGATAHAVSVIKQTLDKHKANLGIKASGGIKTAEQAIAMLELGATRLGTSSGIEIAQNLG